MSSIYFIQRDDGPIKIGLSKNVANRLATLATASANELKLLGAVPGDKKTEAKIHRQLRDFRMNREWFRPCDEVISLIEQCIKEPALPLTEPEDDAEAAQRREEIKMVCRAYIDGIAYPRPIDETKAQTLQRVAKTTRLSYRTIKSIVYDESGEVSAFTLLTLRKYFAMKTKEMGEKHDH